MTWVRLLPIRLIFWKRNIIPFIMIVYIPTEVSPPRVPIVLDDQDMDQEAASRGYQPAPSLVVEQELTESYVQTSLVEKTSGQDTTPDRGYSAFTRFNGEQPQGKSMLIENRLGIDLELLAQMLPEPTQNLLDHRSPGIIIGVSTTSELHQAACQ